MNPFFFGEAEKALFGLYHPAAGQTSRQSGIVLCYPFGHEYMRSHRAFRQLANELSAIGFHVLRFDYYATGDSTGDSHEGSLEQWLEDIVAAIDELKDTAAVDRISLVGLRLGAALALTAATIRNDLDAVVMWNPVVDGSTYVRELLAMARRDGGRVETGGAEHEETMGVRGFPLTRRLREAMEHIDLLALDGIAARQVYILSSKRHDEYSRLQTRLNSMELDATCKSVRCSVPWSESDDDVTAVLPTDILQNVVDYFAEASFT
jgi:pimeloyl-ACP methyl ester carboxylesterase